MLSSRALALLLCYWRRRSTNETEGVRVVYYLLVYINRNDLLTVFIKRYSLNGVSKPGYISAGSTMNSTRSYSTNSDHYAIVHSRPGSRYSAPGANGVHHGQRQQQNGQANNHHHQTATQPRRDPRNGNGEVHHGPGPGSISGSHYSAK